LKIYHFINNFTFLLFAKMFEKIRDLLPIAQEITNTENIQNNKFGDVKDDFAKDNQNLKEIFQNEPLFQKDLKLEKPNRKDSLINNLSK